MIANAKHCAWGLLSVLVILGCEPRATIYAADSSLRRDSGVRDQAEPFDHGVAEGHVLADGGQNDISPSDFGFWDHAIADTALPDDGQLDRAVDDANVIIGNLSPGSSVRQYNVAGFSRSVALRVPSQVSSGPCPLVLVLHGNGDTASNFLLTSGLATAASARGMIIAAPDGIEQDIEYGGQTIAGVDWDGYRSVAEGNIDLPLFSAIYQDLVATGSVNTQQVYVFGYSQGGYMSFRVAIDESLIYAAAVVVAGASPLGPSLVSRAARTIPMALTIGSNDWGVSNARDCRDALLAAGHEVRWNEVAGAGHVPYCGDSPALLDWLLTYTLSGQ